MIWTSKENRETHIGKQVRYFKLGDLTKDFKNQSKVCGLDVMDSKNSPAVFTQGSVVGKHSWRLPGWIAVVRNCRCGASEEPVVIARPEVLRRCTGW